MFTGIIEHVGKLLQARPAAGGARLRIDAGPVAQGAVLGASIAVNGVCLTIAQMAPPVLEFDAVRETLEGSSLGQLAAGSRVNLERSLQVGARLDGHFVQGHVDGMARVANIVDTPEEYVFTLQPEPALMPYMVPKGSVSLDGISLTIAAVSRDAFSVAIIPTTRTHTTIADWQSGTLINIETDIIARAIVHHLQAMQRGGQAIGGVNASALTWDKLEQAGFA